MRRSRTPCRRPPKHPGVVSRQAAPVRCPTTSKCRGPPDRLLTLVLLPVVIGSSGRATLQQLFKCGGERVSDAPQVIYQVRAGDDADAESAIERHNGDVESRARDSRAERVHPVDSATQEIELFLWAGHVR